MFYSNYDTPQEDPIEEVKEPQVMMIVDGKRGSTSMTSGMIFTKNIQDRKNSKVLRVLYDSSDLMSMYYKYILPRGVLIKQKAKTMLLCTLTGMYAPIDFVAINGIQLLAFDKSRVIDKHDFQGFDSECQYDVILGGDFFKNIGVNFIYDSLEIE